MLSSRGTFASPPLCQLAAATTTTTTTTAIAIGIATNPPPLVVLLLLLLLLLLSLLGYFVLRLTNLDRWNCTPAGFCCWDCEKIGRWIDGQGVSETGGGRGEEGGGEGRGGTEKRVRGAPRSE